MVSIKKSWEIYDGKDFKKLICRHVWPNKRIKGDQEIHYIRPSRLLGSPLAFNPKRIKANLELGYEDTIKQLKDLDL